MGYFVPVIVFMLMIYGAMELAYSMGEQKSCAAQSSFYRQYAPALQSREQNASHSTSSDTSVAGAA